MYREVVCGSWIVVVVVEVLGDLAVAGLSVCSSTHRRAQLENESGQGVKRETG